MSMKDGCHRPGLSYPFLPQGGGAYDMKILKHITDFAKPKRTDLFPLEFLVTFPHVPVSALTKIKVGDFEIDRAGTVDLRIKKIVTIEYPKKINIHLAKKNKSHVKVTHPIKYAHVKAIVQLEGYEQDQLFYFKDQLIVRGSEFNAHLQDYHIKNAKVIDIVNQKIY